MLGGAILYWMYRDFDFGSISHVLLDEMNWGWMLLSFPFGILAQAFRGWRWRQTLEPIGEKPRSTVSIYSVFLSYAASLVIPRVGEFTRCGVLKRYDGVSFSKALGTVVTERAIDSLVVAGVLRTHPPAAVEHLQCVLLSHRHEHGVYPQSLLTYGIFRHRRMRCVGTCAASFSPQEAIYI